MAQITAAIGQSRMELVRDAIGVILRDELTNQATLQTDPDLVSQLNALQVFGERFAPLNHNDMPAIDIFFFNGDFDNKAQHSKRGTYHYYIDIFTASNANAADDADRRSSLRAHRLAMLVNAILEDPHYLTLGFQASDGVIQTTLLRNIKRTEESYNRDGRGMMMYRMIFEVVVAEQTGTITGVPLTLVTTNVRIDETDIGYQYIYQAP